jgi:hypothetical protein
MESYPKEIKIKETEKILLRPAEPKDGKKIEEFLLKIPSKEKAVLKEAIEDAGDIESWIKEAGKSVFPPLLAENEKENEIVGIVFSRKSKGKQSSHFQDMILLVEIDYKMTRLSALLSKEYFSAVLKKKEKK